MFVPNPCLDEGCMSEHDAICVDILPPERLLEAVFAQAELVVKEIRRQRDEEQSRMQSAWRARYAAD